MPFCIFVTPLHVVPKIIYALELALESTIPEQFISLSCPTTQLVFDLLHFRYANYEC